MAIVGYERVWPSGPKGQKAALTEAGCSLIYTDKGVAGADPLTQRSFAIKAMRAGWKLAVVAPEVFGRNDAEIAEGLRALHAATEGQGAILDLSTGAEVAWTPEAQPSLDFVTRAVLALRSRKTAAGRAAAQGRGGRKPKLQGPKKAAAAADWNARNGSQAEIAKRHGVSVNTMHVLFGPWTGHD